MSEVNALKKSVDSELMAGSPQIKRYLSRHSTDAQEAADVYQESITRVLEQARERSIRNPVAYAIRVARNLIISKPQPQYTDEQSLLCHAPSPEELAARAQRIEQFSQFLKAMPRLRREVFIRRRLHGESRTTIARALEISEESVKKHMTRAIADFQRHLDRVGV